MSKKYDPNKKLRKIWKICENPLDLIIAFEKDTGRYLLSDPTKTYGRILDTVEETIYAPIYVLSIMKYDPIPAWHKYEGSQDKLMELLNKVKTIWYTDKDSKDFHIEDYIKKARD
ncbi:hypothetical protein [Fonticella tunisiensis]|uniref:Uncharacterized protein n=1 Tax=Fonticella tunisiensis TaxID=1096341 RepID=A0A4R7KVV8_9CLOT|nr:hypothetical protein [Fonticella tunisiensis]TDT63681.1 hypothetical protein EDD71_101108 [Fonticella tunisiensis]